MPPQRNLRLAAVIRELGWSQEVTAAHLRRVAAEAGETSLTAVDRSHIAHWIRGVRPQGRTPHILSEALSRGLGRVVTPADIGLGADDDGDVPLPPWEAETLTALADLGSTDMDMDRRQILVNSAFSVAGLALPTDAWWQDRRDRARTRRPGTQTLVTPEDVQSVREMTAFFSRRDQQRGGRSGRLALVAYLRSEVTAYLNGRFPSEHVRTQMMTAAGEATYLAGWTAFDAGEHAIAQRYFRSALQLAAEADDAPLAGHIFRAMAHQALDLNHSRQALDLATASLDTKRYSLATPREKALLGVVHARALATDGQNTAATAALTRAEDDLRAADGAADEPERVWFFGEASLAHESARTLAVLGDLPGAERELRRSVRTRKAAPFRRTHAVTLYYLGNIQVRQGHLDAAMASWEESLTAMGGVRSGRTRDAALGIRRALGPYRSRGGTAAAELDVRAAEMLRRIS